MATITRTVTEERTHKESHLLANSLLVILLAVLAICLYLFVMHASAETIAFVGGLAVMLVVDLVGALIVLVYLRRLNGQLTQRDAELNQLRQALINRGREPYGYGAPDRPNMLVIDPSLFQGRRGRATPSYRTDPLPPSDGRATWDPDGYSQEDGL